MVGKRRVRIVRVTGERRNEILDDVCRHLGARPGKKLARTPTYPATREWATTMADAYAREVKQAERGPKFARTRDRYAGTRRAAAKLADRIAGQARLLLSLERPLGFPDLRAMAHARLYHVISDGPPPTLPGYDLIDEIDELVGRLRAFAAWLSEVDAAWPKEGGSRNVATFLHGSPNLALAAACCGMAALCLGSDRVSARKIEDLMRLIQQLAGHDTDCGNQRDARKVVSAHKRRERLRRKKWAVVLEWGEALAADITRRPVVPGLLALDEPPTVFDSLREEYASIEEAERATPFHWPLGA